MKRVPGLLLLALLAAGPLWSAKALGENRATAGTPADTTCENAITTPEINECARTQMAAAEVALNEVYARIRSDLASQDCDMNCGETRKLLTLAQRQWVDFRRQDCDAVWQYNADGSIRTVAFLSCMQRHAEDRTRQLRDAYEPDR